MNTLLDAILIVGAYLLGSIPFALVIGKGIYGVDVRESGSGNIGTTNVFRVLGKKAGTLVFLGDVAKGFLPVFLASRLVEADQAAVVSVLAAGAAIAGHTWPLFLGFKGGKGVATGGGTIMALMPPLFLLAFAVFWLVLIAGRMVSIASLSAAAFLSAAVIITGQPLPYIIFTLAGSAVIFYAHRSNMVRIARGKENRVTFPWNRDSGERV
jgi:glycerol-3-phosphate acyltransferase PlsY